MRTSPPTDWAAPPEPDRRRPNVVLVNCDDLGYGDLSCYGSTGNRTPVVDTLAARGGRGRIRFTDFYMASPVCSPLRGAMLTGSYPRRIGFGSFDGRAVLFPGMGLGLNPAERTIASLLREQGYATMLVGKWHCGDQPGFLPTDDGFDRYFGLPYSNDMGRQVGAEGEVGAGPAMGDEPLIVMQAGIRNESSPLAYSKAEWEAFQRLAATISSNAVYGVVDGSAHLIPARNPDAVVAATTAVSQSIRDGNAPLGDCPAGLAQAGVTCVSATSPPTR